MKKQGYLPFPLMTNPTIPENPNWYSFHIWFTLITQIHALTARLLIHHKPQANLHKQHQTQTQYTHTNIRWMPLAINFTLTHSTDASSAIYIWIRVKSQKLAARLTANHSNRSPSLSLQCVKFFGVNYMNPTSSTLPHIDSSWYSHCAVHCHCNLVRLQSLYWQCQRQADERQRRSQLRVLCTCM